jgi:hypothetical protein
MSVAGVLRRINVEPAGVIPYNAARRGRVGWIKALEIGGAPEFDLARPIRCECENVFVHFLEFNHPGVWHEDVFGEVLGHFDERRNSEDDNFGWDAGSEGRNR